MPFMKRPESLFRPSLSPVKLFSPSLLYVDCGCCGAMHAAEFTGDCRDNAARLDYADLDAKHGYGQWRWKEDA